MAFNDVLNISYNSASSWNVNQSFFLVLNLNITFKTGQFRGRSKISEFGGRVTGNLWAGHWDGHWTVTGNLWAGFRPDSEIIEKSRKSENFYDHFVWCQKWHTCQFWVRRRVPVVFLGSLPLKIMYSRVILEIPFLEHRWPWNFIENSNTKNLRSPPTQFF